MIGTFPKSKISILLASILALAGCAHIDQMQERIADQDRQIAKLREENKQFQDAYYQIKSTMDSETGKAGQTVAQMQRELEQAKTLQSQRETDLANQLRTRGLELEAQKSEFSDYKTINEARLGQLGQQVQTTSAERDAALERLAKREEDLRAEQGRTDTLTKQVASLTVDLQAAKDNLAGIEKDLAAAKQTLATREKEMAELQKRGEDFSSQVKALEQQLAESKKQAETTNQQLGNAQKKAAEADKLAARQKELEEQLGKAKEDAKTAATKASAASTGGASLAEDAELKETANKFKETLTTQSGASADATDVKLDRSGLRVLISSDVLFKKNAIVLSDEAPAMLKPVIELIKSMPGREVVVEGHTDTQPIQDLPFKDNWGLGFARADRVREYLMSDGGIAASRLTALTRGGEQPVDGGGNVKSRRVEIVIGGKK